MSASEIPEAHKKYAGLPNDVPENLPIAGPGDQKTLDFLNANTPEVTNIRFGHESAMANFTGKGVVDLAKRIPHLMMPGKKKSEKTGKWISKDTPEGGMSEFTFHPGSHDAEHEQLEIDRKKLSRKEWREKEEALEAAYQKRKGPQIAFEDIDVESLAISPEEKESLKKIQELIRREKAKIQQDAITGLYDAQPQDENKKPIEIHFTEDEKRNVEVKDTGDVIESLRRMGEHLANNYKVQLEGKEVVKTEKKNLPPAIEDFKIKYQKIIQAEKEEKAKENRELKEKYEKADQAFRDLLAKQQRELAEKRLAIEEAMEAEVFRLKSGLILKLESSRIEAVNAQEKILDEIRALANSGTATKKQFDQKNLELDAAANRATDFSKLIDSIKACKDKIELENVGRKILTLDEQTALMIKPIPVEEPVVVPVVAPSPEQTAPTSPVTQDETAFHDTELGAEVKERSYWRAGIDKWKRKISTGIEKINPSQKTIRNIKKSAKILAGVTTVGAVGVGGALVYDEFTDDAPNREPIKKETSIDTTAQGKTPRTTQPYDTIQMPGTVPINIDTATKAPLVNPEEGRPELVPPGVPEANPKANPGLPENLQKPGLRTEAGNPSTEIFPNDRHYNGEEIIKIANLSTAEKDTLRSVMQREVNDKFKLQATNVWNTYKNDTVHNVFYSILHTGPQLYKQLPLNAKNLLKTMLWVRGIDDTTINNKETIEEFMLKSYIIFMRNGVDLNLEKNPKWPKPLGSEIDDGRPR